MQKLSKFSITLLSLSFLLCSTFSMYALNYNISFTASGARTSVGDVLVQNLTKGTSVTVPAGNVLNLTVSTDVEQLSATDETIHIYPNSVEGKSTISFFAKQAGVTQINAISMDGKKIAGISVNLQTGSNTFELSLPKGIFAIQVKGNQYEYTAKIINQTGVQSNQGIAYIGTKELVSSSPQKSKSSALGVTAMSYTSGDQLLYKATSGTYSAIVTDVPTSGKITNFNFAACTDADGNNYTTVTIGTQTWMAENLKTTKYKDFTAIPNVTSSQTWYNLSTPAYCCYNNNAAVYKAPLGALYNWYAVNTGKLAPTGWHIPTDAEWNTLTVYVTSNLGTSLNAAKALAASTDWWYTDVLTGTIGCNLNLNNSTGFSALPGGSCGGPYSYVNSFNNLYDRGNWWSASGSYWLLYNNGGEVDTKYPNGPYGFSVRCVRD